MRNALTRAEILPALARVGGIDRKGANLECGKTKRTSAVEHVLLPCLSLVGAP